MKKQIRWTVAGMAWLVAGGVAVAAMSPAKETGAREAAGRGAAWLAAQQAEDGHWGSPDTPAMTALAFWALQRTDAQTYAEAIERGMDFVSTPPVVPSVTVMFPISLAHPGRRLAPLPQSLYIPQ